MWARLSLRQQAAIAVVMPCLAVAIFSSLYFPRRLNEQAQEGLERQARSVGLLAATNAAPTMRLVRDGLASSEELDSVLTGVRTANAQRIGFFAVTSQTVTTEGEKRFLEATPENHALVRGDLKPQRFELPPTGTCAADLGASLSVRCTAKDGDYEGLLVAVFPLDALEEARKQNQLVGLWVLLVTFGVGLALAFIFSGALASPISQVTKVAKEVAGGDVSVSQLDVGGSGDVRSMASSLNEMLVSLRHLVTQMVSLTQRLSGASQGLITASADQEHVTSQQSAYAQQIAATFEELSRTAERINQSTDVVEQAAQRTAVAVDEGRAVVSQVVNEIAGIRRESKEVADAITQLNDDLQQVSRIAQVIKQVADRSDLLALNAALEGTKAGEVGRGFSLVAAEMRKLAESVAVSARDIGRLVERVQDSGNQAVTKAREGVETSDRGVAVAERASSVFEQIVELSQGTKEAAQQIAVATRQQRQSSEQAVAGARNVADLVKQGVDATGRSTKIAHDLQAAVVALSEVTQRFKVEKPS